MREKIVSEQERRRKIRDVGARDPLTLDKLKELMALWQDRLTNKEYPDDTCKRMIRLYEIRIARMGG